VLGTKNHEMPNWVVKADGKHQQQQKKELE